MSVSVGSGIELFYADGVTFWKSVPDLRQLAGIAWRQAEAAGQFLQRLGLRRADAKSNEHIIGLS